VGAVATSVPPLVFLAAASPVGAAAFAAAVGRRDGISLDAWLIKAIRHRRRRHSLVPTDGPITPAPAWVATSTGPGNRQPLPAPLTLPATGVTADGTVDRGNDGAAALIHASTVSFDLRTPAEQHGVIDAFGHWLTGGEVVHYGSALVARRSPKSPTNRGS
jgi:hypothetical protein